MLLFWLVCPGGFSQNGALVVLVEVLPGPACVASAVLLAAVFSLMVRVVIPLRVVKRRPVAAGCVRVHKGDCTLG